MISGRSSRAFSGGNEMDQAQANKLAEQVVLGSVLLDETVLLRIVETLDETWFSHAPHKVIYRTFLDRYVRKVPIDPAMVIEALRRQGQLEEAGGESYISSLTSRAARRDIDHYITVVADTALRRAIARCARQILDETGSTDITSRELLEKAQKEFHLLHERNCPGGRFKELGNVLPDIREHLERVARRSTSVVGIETGFAQLDRLTHGFHKGDLTLLVGPSGSGKTSLALAIARHVAFESWQKVALFSLDASVMQIVQRLLCLDAQVSLHGLRNGQLQEEDQIRVSQSSNQLAPVPLFICDTPDLSLLEIQLAALRLQREDGIDLVVIDYLQLMHSGKSSGSHTEEVEHVVAGVKELAGILDVPVLGLFQWRNPNSWQPQVSDLDESGYSAITKKADVVLFLDRPVPGVSPGERHLDDIAELAIGKQRNGPTGSIHLLWDSETVGYKELA